MKNKEQLLEELKRELTWLFSGQISEGKEGPINEIVETLLGVADELAEGRDPMVVSMESIEQHAQVVSQRLLHARELVLTLARSTQRESSIFEFGQIAGMLATASGACSAAAEILKHQLQCACAQTAETERPPPPETTAADA